jgi:hypothetical protein
MVGREVGVCGFADHEAFIGPFGQHRSLKKQNDKELM